MDVYDIPVDLRRILLDFTISCLHDKPKDYVEQGRKYFSNLLERRSEHEIVDRVSFKALARRRESVVADRYDPTEDSESLDSIIIPKSDEDRKTLAAAIKKVLIFKNLDSQELETILNAMDHRDVNKGEVIIQQGNVINDNFYVIQEGVFEASITLESGKSSVVRTYDNSGSFGELALLYNVPRAATVTAATDGQLWTLDRKTFQKIVIGSAFRKREAYEALINSVEFLNHLSNYEKLDLADSLESKTYSDQEVIFKQGDTADGMYFVQTGAVNCCMEGGSSGRPVSLKIVEGGGYFGELALLTHKPRALSAYAMGPTKLAFLDKMTFERLLGNCMDVLSRNIDVYQNVLRTLLTSQSEMIQ